MRIAENVQKEVLDATPKSSENAKSKLHLVL